jgi:hypothetical protein
MGASKVKQRYLVVYDYGQGGVWAYVRAASKRTILTRFPELNVVDDPPPGLSQERLRKLMENTQDIDKPGPGLLADILADRPSNNA